MIRDKDGGGGGGVVKKELRFRGSRDADNLSHDYRITCIINELSPDTRYIITD